MQEIIWLALLLVVYVYGLGYFSKYFDAVDDKHEVYCYLNFPAFVEKGCDCGKVRRRRVQFRAACWPCWMLWQIVRILGKPLVYVLKAGELVGRVKHD